MKILQAEPGFRPVTIVLETQDDFDKLYAIVSSVADNRTNHTPPIITAAADLRRTLNNLD